jgi:hypothetical protein
MDRDGVIASATFPAMNNFARAVLLLCLIGLVASLTGCSSMPAADPLPRILPTIGQREVPGANLPVGLRPYNWVDSRGHGSCANASSVYNLHWAGLPNIATWWRRNHAGGETAVSLRQKHDAAQLKYFYTLKAEPTLLDWCTKTRRSAVIWYYPSHAINFTGFARDPHSPSDPKTYAWLLDNNRPQNFIKVERDKFLRNWAGYGGFGLSLASPPVPPPLFDALVRNQP